MALSPAWQARDITCANLHQSDTGSCVTVQVQASPRCRSQLTAPTRSPGRASGRRCCCCSPGSTPRAPACRTAVDRDINTPTQLPRSLSNGDCHAASSRRAGRHVWHGDLAQVHASSWGSTHLGLGMLRLGSKTLLPVVSASLTTQMREMKMKGAMMARAAVACQLRDATSAASEGHMQRQLCKSADQRAGTLQHERVMHNVRHSAWNASVGSRCCNSQPL